MYRNDGTRFDCSSLDEYEPGKVYRAIGWLGNRPISTGEVPPGFVARLIEIAFTCRKNVTRGSFGCRYCSMRDLRISADGKRTFPLGSAEIWVPTNDSTVYCAPNLVVHYVREHKYQPPQAFIDAVIQATSEV